MYEALRALTRSASFTLLGVPATVTPPSGSPVETRIIWLTPLNDGAPTGAALQRIDPRRGMAIRRDQVPQVPLGTLIAVSEPNRETPALWRVDSTILIEPEHTRVMVLPAEES